MHSFLSEPRTILLPQLMTRVAPHGCFVLLVAVDTPLHLQGLLNTHTLLRCDIAMTTRTLDLRCRMRTVAEEDEARQLMDELQRNLALRQIHVTALAPRQSWKARSVR